MPFRMDVIPGCAVQDRLVFLGDKHLVLGRRLLLLRLWHRSERKGIGLRRRRLAKYPPTTLPHAVNGEFRYATYVPGKSKPAGEVFSSPLQTLVWMTQKDCRQYSQMKRLKMMREPLIQMRASTVLQKVKG